MTTEHPPPHESPKNIMNCMPDNCIGHIFDYLTLNDLSNVADTCTKFRSNAQKVFKRSFHHMVESNIDAMKKRTLARCLRNFGGMITRYTLDANVRLYGTSNRYLELFFRHCAVPSCSLRHLTVKNFTLEHKQMFSKQLKAITPHLQTLKASASPGIGMTFGLKSNGRRYIIRRN